MTLKSRTPGNWDVAYFGGSRDRQRSQVLSLGQLAVFGTLYAFVYVRVAGGRALSRFQFYAKQLQ